MPKPLLGDEFAHTQYDQISNSWVEEYQLILDGDSPNFGVLSMGHEDGQVE